MLSTKELTRSKRHGLSLQDVLFIANDWQTGLLPVYHLYKYRRNNTYRNSRCMFVIHNIGYQARCLLKENTQKPLDEEHLRSS